MLRKFLLLVKNIPNKVQDIAFCFFCFIKILTSVNPINFILGIYVFVDRRIKSRIRFVIFHKMLRRFRVVINMGYIIKHFIEKFCSRNV